LAKAEMAMPPIPIKCIFILPYFTLSASSEQAKTQIAPTKLIYLSPDRTLFETNGFRWKSATGCNYFWLCYI